MVDRLEGLFITGTNTGVGKTHVAAMMARELHAAGTRVGVYKPVCSGSVRTPEGSEVWPDVERLFAALGGRFARDLICPQRFTAALAPDAAARREGKAVDSSLLRSGAAAWRAKVDRLLVEGVGGWSSPIAEGETVADLATDLQYPVLLVAALELGAINHTLLTVESIGRRGLPIAGIVFNEVACQVDPAVADSTIQGIRAHTDVRILGRLAHGSDSLLGQGFGGWLDWNGGEFKYCCQ